MLQGSPCGIRAFQWIPWFALLFHISSLRFSSGHSGLVLTIRTNDTACSSLPSPHSLVVDTSIWASSLSLLVVVVRCTFCGFVFFPSPGYVALWDSKIPHRHACERVSYCVETSPWLPLQDGSPSLNLLSLFPSFIFCPICFWRDWTAFLGVWCSLTVFRSCFVDVAQHSNDCLMNLWGRKWSPCPVPPPSWEMNVEF